MADRGLRYTVYLIMTPFGSAGTRQRTSMTVIATIRVVTSRGGEGAETIVIQREKRKIRRNMLKCSLVWFSFNQKQR